VETLRRTISRAEKRKKFGRLHQKGRLYFEIEVFLAQRKVSQDLAVEVSGDDGCHVPDGELRGL
jgi:hypothetical protein